MQNKSRLSKSVKDELFSVAEKADADRDYAAAIKVYEKFSRKFYFPNEVKYKFGVLLDHAAMNILKKNRNSIKAKKFLNLAEAEYDAIITSDKKDVLAHRGLARVHELRKEWEEAESYLLKAYKIWKNIPKDEKGPLGIGGFYEETGNLKKAEHWYKAELKELGEEDLAAVFNLFMFCKRSKNIKKVDLLRPKIKVAIEKMFPDKGNLLAVSKSNTTFRFILKESGIIK